MSARSILVVGDSHTHALKAALAKRGEGGLEGAGAVAVAVDVVRPVATKGGKAIGDLTLEQVEARAAGLGPGDLLALILRGNQYNMIGLMQHPRPFDVLLEGEPSGGQGIGPDVELIPAAALRDFFASSLEAGYGALYRRLVRASGAPVACIEIPAPKEDAAHVLRGAESFFVEQGIARVGVTPAPVRLKLWTLQQEALARFCDRLGVAYLPSPPGTRDEGGFLRREFYAKDATHANAAYGELVLRHLEGLVADRSAAHAEVTP